MSKKLLVGIAGYGVVGKRRRQYIDAHPDLQTVAVCDQNFEGSGVLEDGVQFFNCHKDLLELSLDMLFVSLPNYLAAEVTIAGIRKDMHVFCEKPPGCRPEDIESVIEVEKAHPEKCLKYGFNHRYHKSVQDALSIINSGDLGTIVNLRGVYGKSKIIPFEGGWRSERKLAGGGILLDQGIHMVDLMRLFCGDFCEVKSYVSNSYWHHDVEDNAYALMKDNFGRVAMLHSSATQWQHKFSLDISLTEGYLLLEGILSGSKSYGEESLTIGHRSESDVGTLKLEKVKYLEDNSWKEEIWEFVDAVIQDCKIKNGTSQDALATMQLVYQIYNADSEWKEKYL